MRRREEYTVIYYRVEVFDSQGRDLLPPRTVPFVTGGDLDSAASEAEDTARKLVPQPERIAFVVATATTDVTNQPIKE